MAEDEFAYWGETSTENNEGEFAYWGNEGAEDVEHSTLEEQVAELQVIVQEQGALIEEQGAVINELSESVTYKVEGAKPAVPRITTKGSTKPRFSTREMARAVRMPMMKPERMAKTGIRLGARMALKELGVSVPYLGLIIALTFQAYDSIMKEIAHQAAIDVIKQHEKESRLETEQKFGDAIRKVEEARREQYRSLVP